MTTPLLGLAEIAEGVANQTTIHNTALRQMEARSFRVLSLSTTAPAVSPAESDSYIIPAGATGAWAGKTNQIASWIGGAWTYYAPVEGIGGIWVNDLDTAYSFDGAAWVATGGSGISAPFSDSTALVKGSADPTKILKFEVDGFTTATTRTVTVPNKSGTMAMLDDLAAMTIADGDKGDVVVSASGATWMFDSGVVSAFARSILDDADAAAVRATIGAGTGTGSGDVVGPASAVNNHLVVFDGATGKLIKDGGVAPTGTNTGDETTATTGGLINGATAKTTPVDADFMGLMDSAASNVLKKLSWANIKATLKTYFDTIYAAFGEPVNAQTGTTYTYLNSDAGKLVTHTNASAIAGTLPQTGSGGNFTSGWWMDVQNRGAGTLTITPATSTIDGAATLTFTTGQGARIISDGTNYFTQRGGAGATAGGGSSTSITGAAGGQGGDATATGGTSSTAANAGGKALVVGGTPGATGVGGIASVKGGPGGTTSGAGGNAVVSGGAFTSNAGIGNPGSATFSGAGIGGNNGGNVAIAGGDGFTTGGSVTIASGASTFNGQAGPISITVGASQTTGQNLSLTAGTGAGGGSVGGAVNIAGGAAGSAVGGPVNITGGAGGNTNGGGAVVLTGGAPNGATPRGNVVLNGSGAALATAATGGFTCIPTCAGAPTGTPANIPTGTAPMVFDSTNFNLYVYVSGAWKKTSVFA